jgi:hypothetical protein
MLWVAQEAIEAAEKGDNAGVARVFAALTRPFDDADDHYGGPPPARHAELCVT